MDTIVPEPSDKHQTKRRYADELYPHPDEWEVQPLAEAVPYLYARATGLSVFGTDWFDLRDTPEGVRLMSERINHLILARQRALLADALLQGMGGQDAWEWAESRYSEDGEIVYDRAVHYGVPVDRIKPYPVVDEPDHHDHRGEPDARGWREVTQVDGPESGCPDCCEPEPTGETA